MRGKFMNEQEVENIIKKTDGRKPWYSQEGSTDKAGD